MSLEFEIEYNTSREEMKIPEYGRNIQKMIEYAKTLADKNERNRAANSIIKVMGQVNPYLKANEDLTHKLWDHMFIISDFDFDVDSPFPKPVREDFETGPDKIPYPENEIVFRHYGRIVEQMIKTVADVEDEQERLKMGVGVANILKRAYLNWNRDSVENRVIIKNLRDMSGGKINLPDDTELAHSRDLVDGMQQMSNQPNRPRKGRTNNRKKKTGRRNPRT
ncbi:MAG: DUF4290 domain-containing protein [Flavobacteriales bacterium]|nr:DUF4290 domain-containing protein [Flavobacteriales bacterium]